MFDNLSNSLTSAIGTLRGRGKLSESNMREGLSEVRTALLEADVAYDVVEAFLDSRANDQESFTFTPPGEGFTKTGTYSQSGTTVTITISNHGVAIGDVLTIDYTSGSATDGSFTVATAADANTFTVTAASSATNSGNVSITLSGAKLFVCEGWNKSIPYNNRASISATFRQVFEP